MLPAILPAPVFPLRCTHLTQLPQPSPCDPIPVAHLQFSAELRFQIRRLASHPSIALWGGNNEVEASFDWFEVTGTDKGGRAYAADFLQLFSQALRDVVLQVRGTWCCMWEESGAAGEKAGRALSCTDRRQRWCCTPGMPLMGLRCLFPQTPAALTQPISLSTPSQELHRCLQLTCFMATPPQVLPIPLPLPLSLNSCRSHAFLAHHFIYSPDLAPFLPLLPQLDPGRPYVDTSPSNLLYSTQPYLRRWGDPQNPDYGDVHFYNYKWVRGWNKMAASEWQLRECTTEGV